MARRNSDSGRQAVIWLATTYITVIATGAAAFVIIAVTEKPDGPLWILGGSVSGLLLIMMLMNISWDEPVSQLKYWLSAQERHDPTKDYSAARRRIASREKFGGNAPPSIDSVRDAADHGGAWVPRSTGTPKPPKKS